MLRGLNHITLAVADLARSFDFYVDRLRCRPVARWSRGAYLDAGGLWLALIEAEEVPARTDYSHIAFSCDRADFAAMVERLGDCPAWQENRSEGDSHYFLDPDGHRLELHVGDLQSRLTAMRENPWDEIEFF